MRYVPKTNLRFRLPNGTIVEKQVKPSRDLSSILKELGFEKAYKRGYLKRTKFGRKELDPKKNVGRLEIQNDDVIEVE